MDRIQANFSYVHWAIPTQGRQGVERAANRISKETPSGQQVSGQSSDMDNNAAGSGAKGKVTSDGDRLTLSREAIAMLQKLQARDREVKAHEMAHIAAGGAYVRGGASYKYEIGPDGKRYAVGGEVKIDTSPERTPEATIKKMETVKRAALAPAHPSAQDRRVAAQAAQAIQKALMEIFRESSEQKRSSSATTDSQGTGQVQAAETDKEGQ